MEAERDGDASRLLWIERLRLSISIVAEMVDLMSKVVAALTEDVGEKEIVQELDNLELLFSSLFPK